MRIGVAATPNVAVPTLDWLLSSHHELKLLITQPDKPHGRGRSISQSDVATWGDAHGVAVFKTNSQEEIKTLCQDLDLLITIGFGVLLRKEVLSAPRFGCINLHFSLLPKFRGAAPVQRAIEAGESETGVTVFKLDEGMDTGPVYSKIKHPIHPDARSKELLAELSEIGVDAVKNSLTNIEAGIEPTSQMGDFSLAPKLSKQEAQLDWNFPAVKLGAKIRAFYPDPCAWTLFRGDVLKIIQAKSYSISSSLLPGQIKVIDGHCLVGTSSGDVELLTVVPAGKKEMLAVDWSRGARFTAEEYCG